MYRIRLEKDKGTVLVDDCDQDLGGVKWYANGEGYAVRMAGKGTGRTTERLHVVVARRKYGAIPQGMQVDHKDGNRLDCRRDELRLATPAQQMQNRRRRSLGGVETPYKGIHFHKKSGFWQAEMRVKGKYTYIGIFKDELDAARAYDAKARELYGEYARCNFPEQAQAS